MNNKNVNVTLDTGAGCSIIDHGSLEYIGMQNAVKKFDSRLINASGNEMDIIGVVDINVRIDGNKPLMHEFKVLNTKSYTNILLGRDFIKLFRTVKFDFYNNKVQLGDTWINSLHIECDEKVRLKERTTIPARTEKVVSVRCKKELSIQMVDFDPVPLKGVAGVFVSRARVIPNVNGVFQISVLNVTEADVTLNCRKLMGHIFQPDELICDIKTSNENSSPPISQLQYGGNLTSEQGIKVRELIKKYDVLFTENSKKPKQSKLIKHRIITNDALP